MALTKVIGTGVGNLDALGVGTASPSHPIHVVTSTDGTGVSGDDKFVAVFQNAEATNGRSYGVKIMAGSTTDQALTITDHDGSNDLMAVDGYGHVTMPKQSAFLVNPSSNQTNISVNATTTIAFGTERFDQNADFSSNTFTAPVTGRYQFNLFSFINDLNHGYSIFQVRLNTSNVTMTWIIDPRFGDANPDYYPVHFSTLVDMDANDTAHVEMVIPNYGSAQVDFDASSYFSGYLVC